MFHTGADDCQNGKSSAVSSYVAKEVASITISGLPKV